MFHWIASDIEKVFSVFYHENFGEAVKTAFYMSLGKGGGIKFTSKVIFLTLSDIEQEYFGLHISFMHGCQNCILFVPSNNLSMTCY